MSTWKVAYIKTDVVSVNRGFENNIRIKFTACVTDVLFVGLGMGSPPDLFSPSNSMDNTALSTAHGVVTNQQPDMVPAAAQHGDPVANNDADNIANFPPDMLPLGGQAAVAGDQLEDRMLGAELESGSGSGPDIISNGVRGDERDEKTRPDILSPAREDTDGNIG